MQKFTAGGFTFEKVTEIEARLIAEANNGNMESAEFLAMAYAMGNQEGISKNSEKAREYLNLLIKNVNDVQRVASFHVNIGLTYLEENNNQKAKEAFEKAIELGSTSGISHFTYTVLRELTFKTYKDSEDKEYNLDDIHKMTRFLRKASKEDTQKILQSLTERGLPFDNIIKILEDIAVGQHANGQFIVALDLRHAIWRLVTFSSNDPALQKNADDKRHESATALHALAKSGNPSRQCDLAWCLEHGVGFKTNIDLAKKWYQKAAEQGLSEAQERMKSFEGNEVESVATSIMGMNLNT